MKQGITIYACIMLLLLAFTSNAQTTINEFRKLPAQQRAQRIADTLQVGLKLNSEQHDKIYSIALATTAKADPVMESDLSRRSKAMKLIPIWRDAEKNIKAVLTPAQASVYESRKSALVAEFRKNVGEQPVHFN